MNTRRDAYTIFQSRPRLARNFFVVVSLFLVASAWIVTAQPSPQPRPSPESPALELGPPSSARVDGLSAIIYPLQRLPLRFSHDVHVRGQGMKCVDCHAQARDSIRTRDLLIPTMSDCLTCHELQRDGEPACATCHAFYETTTPELPAPPVDAASAKRVYNPPPGLYLPPAPLIFSHRRHLTAGAQCVDCHGDMVGVALTDRRALPSMRDCWQCHDGEPESPSQDCTTCHLSLGDGRVRTDFPAGKLIPSGTIVPDDHRLDFLSRHATMTDVSREYCQSCHTENFCVDCHNGVTKPVAIHPPNYAQLHAFDAQSDSAQCSNCHSLQSFCLGCHEQTGVGQVRRFTPTGNSFHPDGFTDQVASPNFHGPMARMNLSSCVSCHEEESCIRCHSAINPHGDDFLGRCAAMIERNQNACVRCHVSQADQGNIRMLCQ